MITETLPTTYALLDEFLAQFVEIAEAPFLSTDAVMMRNQKIDRTTVKGILEKMVDDKLLHFNEDPNRFEIGYFRLTFAGRLFYLEGGYMGKYKRDHRAQITSTILNWAIAIGGGVAALYYLLEIIVHIILRKPTF